jgi:hypothetical protein
MNTLAKEALRWVAIVVSGGCGVWQVIDGCRDIVRHSGDWFGLAFVLIVDLALAAPCLAFAYLCLRRQYRQLFLVLGVVGSLAVFVELELLPGQLGVFEIFNRYVHTDHAFALLGLPLCLLMLFGPI